VSLVLIVDDDAVVRVALQNLLAAVGHEVVCAGSVAEAMVLLAQDAQFTQVVLDHDLPDGLGTEIAALLPLALPHAKVVMHSSRTFAAAPYGVAQVVRKGADFGALLDVLDAFAAA
jgi:CheY-like chemotaxis protein